MPATVRAVPPGPVGRPARDDTRPSLVVGVRSEPSLVLVWRGAEPTSRDGHFGAVCPAGPDSMIGIDAAAVVDP